MVRREEMARGLEQGNSWETYNTALRLVIKKSSNPDDAEFAMTLVILLETAPAH